MHRRAEENDDGLRKAAQNNEALEEAGLYSDPSRCCMTFEQIGAHIRSHDL